MKKIVFTVAIALGSLTTFASSAFAMQTSEVILVKVQEEYKEIDVENVPQLVKDALAADFPTASLDKAYVNDEEHYKLEITVEGVATTLYADKDGNWIEE